MIVLKSVTEMLFVLCRIYPIMKHKMFYYSIRMVGYMSGSKKARNTASISNYHQVGVKAGLAPKTNGPAIMFRAYNTSDAQQKQTVPQTSAYVTYQAQVNYLIANNLVSRNPQCSGGVGRRQPYILCHFA